MRWTCFHKLAFAAGMIISISASLSMSAEFHVSPENGSSENDGSLEKPWKSLQEVFDSGLVESQAWDALPYNETRSLVPLNPGAPVRAGDTIWLHSGNYGDFSIQGYHNKSAITIAAAPNSSPSFGMFHLRACSEFNIKGLIVSPKYSNNTEKRTLINIENHGWWGPTDHVTVEDCKLSSADDTSQWTVADWNERSCNGIELDGTSMTVRNNYLKNVNFGISVSAVHSLIEHNVVENFAGDGIRGLGDYSVYQYNTVKNCYDVNSNHDDGFQSWSLGPDGPGSGQVTGIVLRGNTIINYEDPNQPHRGSLQGIGCFDGMYVDWVIENNVVIVDHWHGITLLGAAGCRIVNNTIMDPNDVRPGPPWIQIGNDGDGTPPSNCLVRNNIMASIQLDDGQGMVVDHNLINKDPKALFQNPSAYDLRLKKGSPAIDAGSGEQAPASDILNTPRPQQQGVDIGAFEYTITSRYILSVMGDKTGNRSSVPSGATTGAIPEPASR